LINVIFEIRRWCCGSCPNPAGGSTGGTTYNYSAYGNGSYVMVFTKPDCHGETLDYQDEFSSSSTQIASIIGNVFCSGKNGSYKLGFRLTRNEMDPYVGVEGEIFKIMEDRFTIILPLSYIGWTESWRCLLRHH